MRTPSYPSCRPHGCSFAVISGSSLALPRCNATQEARAAPRDPRSAWLSYARWETAVPCYKLMHLLSARLSLRMEDQATASFRGFNSCQSFAASCWQGQKKRNVFKGRHQFGPTADSKYLWQSQQPQKAQQQSMQDELLCAVSEARPVRFSYVPAAGLQRPSHLWLRSAQRRWREQFLPNQVEQLTGVGEEFLVGWRAPKRAGRGAGERRHGSYVRSSSSALDQAVERREGRYQCGAQNVRTTFANLFSPNRCPCRS